MATRKFPGKLALRPLGLTCEMSGTNGTSRTKSPEQKIKKVALEAFGFKSLRPGQSEAIRSVVDGHDTLVVAPTGSGKSAIYQIAGLLEDGTVLVISPLIALQKDQVDSIQENGIAAEALLINSTKSKTALEADLEKVEAARTKFVFLAPEQLDKPETLACLKEANIKLFVVDEAHCVSQWGHDFRPSYLRLGHVVEQLGHPAVLAMTATAAPRIREEIVSRLGMKRPEILVEGFDRPNIYLRVDHHKDAHKKLEALLHRVRWAEKPGIVYVGTRKEAESIRAGLSEDGIHSLFYHGGLKASERERIQNEFMSGEAEVIVATNAFGMGIDKADIRFVYHFQAPDSLDAYYQEIGRAGRDGERAEAVLFYRKQDIGAQAFHTATGKVAASEFESVCQALSAASDGLDKASLARETGLAPRKLTRILQQMEDAGAIEVDTSGCVQLIEGIDLVAAVQEASAQQNALKEYNKERVEQMRQYAETCECRRNMLLQYFGDEISGRCNNCDSCEAHADVPIVNPCVGTRCEVA